MKFLVNTASLLFLAAFLGAQGPVGSWKDHLSYFTAQAVAPGDDEIYASTGSSLIIYNKTFNELRKAGKIQGLSEAGISTIAWSSEYKVLVIVYQSTNIDFLSGNNVFNIPDIKNKYIAGRKEIYKVRTLGRYAYLAGSFGIVVLDILRKEIRDTWKPGPEGNVVRDLAFSGTEIFAATENGIFYASLSKPGLAYSGNWNRLNSFPNPASPFNAIVSAGGKLYANLAHPFAQSDTVYVVSDYSNVSVLSVISGVKNLSLENWPGGFSVSSPSMARVYYSDGLLIKTVNSYNPGTPDIVHATVKGSDIWIADRSNGLIRGVNMTDFIKLNLPGPYRNNVIFLTCSNGKTFIAGGALDNAWNNQWRPLQVFIHQSNQWHSEISYDHHDPLRVLPDPHNANRFWVSTWGAGLLEYENNVLVKKYDYTNSPLQTIIPGKPYTRICGLAMDRERNIWITHTGMPGSIKILKPDNTWIVFPITIDAPTIGDIIITSSGQKWVILPRGYGLFVLDDNRTPENFSDDRYKQMLVKDTENKIISNVYSIAEDLDGNIWVGTDQGPAVYFNPAKVFDDDVRAYRIKIPRNDGSGLADYMLGTEIISTIAVDGANRKWMGTYNSGVYLISADGTKKILNFNEDNSPLYSNTIASVAIDGKTGEVWIGTAKGVISFRGNATTGGEKFSGVYAFPNPVRENYTGNLTITGLMRNTSIRITDISGNLVYKTVSDGGQATWDLTTYNGQRVSTGVYLIFCASEDGRETSVAKVLVIR